MTYQNRPQEHPYQSQGPQLRHSCDACNIAKVKCSKSKPRCARCEARHVDCVYSVSLRSTKGRNGSARDLGRMVFNGDTIDSPRGTLPPTPITPMSLSNPLVSQAVMPSIQDTAFDASVLDGWTTSFSDVDEQHPFTELGGSDESMMVLPNVFAENGSGPNHQDQFISDRQFMQSPAAFDASRPNFPNNNSPTSTHTCLCRQRILAKLSDSWVSESSSSTAFDKALTENKAIIELCNSIFSCSNQSHVNDTIFMLTLIALITQLITIYDNPHPEYSTSPTTMTNLANTNASIPDDPTTDSSSATSSTPSNHSSTSTPPSQFSGSSGGHQHVRLSLGTYQLDQRDEQILKADLLRIELGKIDALIESFERRFCPSDDCWGGKRRDGREREGKPFGEVLTYLRRRLRTSREMLRSRVMMVS